MFILVCFCFLRPRERLVAGDRDLAHPVPFFLRPRSWEWRSHALRYALACLSLVARGQVPGAGRGPENPGVAPEEACLSLVARGQVRGAYY